MSTYTKIFMICPHCGAHTDSSVDYLDVGESFGPWYCDECGGGYQGNANGAATEVHKIKSRFSKTLDLLVLEPHDKTIYFVLLGNRYHPEPDDGYDGKQFFYESHSCPTNWIGKTVMISVDGNTDPHGLLKFVRSVPSLALPDDPNTEDKIIITAFPEVTDKKYLDIYFDNDI